jgi:DNA repair exonuclease SbcCD ATPase subunit
VKYTNYVEEGLKNHYKNIMKNVAENIEKIDEELEAEKKEKRNFQEKSNRLRSEVDKEKCERNNLEREFADIKIRLEKTLKHKNNVENLYQQKSNEFKVKFDIIDGLAGNQTDLGMRLKMTELDLFKTACKLLKTEQELQEINILLDTERSSLRLLMGKYEADLNSKNNEITFITNDGNVHLNRIEILKKDIQRLNASKNEMFEEYDRLKATKDTEINLLKENITSLNKDLEIFNKNNQRLARNQKIGLIAKGIK